MLKTTNHLPNHYKCYFYLNTFLVLYKKINNDVYYEYIVKI